MSVTNPVQTVERHLIGVRNFREQAEVASDSHWTVISGDQHHPMSAPQAYRFLMQAWDFPLAEAQLSDAGAGRVHATLRLDNGHNYHKIVSATYQVDEGLIVEAKSQDAEAVLNNG